MTRKIVQKKSAVKAPLTIATESEFAYAVGQLALAAQWWTRCDCPKSEPCAHSRHFDVKSDVLTEIYAGALAAIRKPEPRI